ncbi:MAG: SDR family NAD(P)-dependent oxidoreductase [Deltaproteobacteria bacterium]|nr:SDR family NAD(P)-dependent oxidoreductase [Deltaproteobacteria bacterium]
MSHWRDKTALVTGASSGIGQAVARRLCAEGMKVVCCARRTERLEALHDELEQAPGEIWPMTADLRDEQQILRMFAAIREGLGGVDVLINNAGLGYRSPLMTGATDRWREMLEINVLALCICTREAVTDMRTRGDAGHVIHISSMSAHRVPTASGVYSATKFAVRSVTEGLRQELRAAGSRIRVTAISPGFVETEFAAHWNQRPEAAAETYGRYPVIQSDEIADMVAYALSQPGHVQIHDLLVRPTEQPS